MKDQIDIVIPWVDSTDVFWQEEYVKNVGAKLELKDYRDWNLLKYVFRSIERYAPWVNKIYFVTFGHIPSFLNINNPKIVIVKHEDYIPEEYLPTFSSHTIELNLHRIDGLSEKFIYFNDDTFLLKKTVPKDFFYKDLPRDVAIINPIVPVRYNTISNLLINNIGLINEKFSKKQVFLSNIKGWLNPRYGMLNILNLLFIPWTNFPGLLQQHLPSSLTRRALKKIWEEYPEVLDNTCRNKIRNFKMDVNQYLIKEWQIAENKFYPRTVNFGKRFLIKDVNEARIAAKCIDRGRYKAICINDHIEEKNSDSIKKIMEMINESMKRHFNDKSTFEK